MSPENVSNGSGDQGKYLLPRDRILAKIGAYGRRVKCSPSEMDGLQFSSDRSRVFWTPSQDRVLLDSMIEQVRRGAKRRNSFSREAWKHMITRFNRKFSLRYDVQQIKYRLKFYRNQYKVVKSIINQKGFSWDSASHTVKAADSVWEAYLVENPSFVRYRDKEWPYFDDWCKICERSTALGQVSISSPLMELEDEPVIDGSNGVTANGVADSPMGSPLVFEEEIEESQHPREDEDHMDELDKYSPKPLRFERSTRGRRGKAVGLQSALNNIADAMRLRATQRTELTQEKWPVERCIEELNSIEGLEEELFLKSLLAFRDEYNRRVFLSTPGDYRKGWLRMICE